MPRIDHEQFKTVFQQVVHGFPIHSCRFHRHMRTPVLFEPIRQRQYLLGGCPIGAKFFVKFTRGLPHQQTHPKSLLMNVHACAS